MTDKKGRREEEKQSVINAEQTGRERKKGKYM